MKLQVGIECGQSFWRLSSWYRPRIRALRSEYIRGVAIGPVMVWANTWKTVKGEPNG